MLYPDFNELIALKDQRPRLNLTQASAVKSTIPGDHHSPFRGQGLEFDAVREYVFGDDVRNIDWRVTARTGSPHLKLFREEKERSVILCLDMNERMQFGTRNTFKSVQAARAGALLGWRSLANHDRVGACLYGNVSEGLQFFAPKKTRKSLWEMFKIITNPAKESHPISFECALEHMAQAAPTGSLIYFISDFMDLEGNIDRYLNRLCKRCDVIFIAINDPADHSFFPVGIVAFSGASKVVVNTDSLKGRENYYSQWEVNRQWLEKISLRFKIPKIALSTESRIRRDLFLGLKQISRRGRS